MSILAIGINHTTAAVDVREKIAFRPEQLEIALRSLVQQAKVTESVILSTCNRTELYCHGSQIDSQKVIQWLAEFHALAREQFESSIYQLKNDEAIEHLMSVASGLDSLVLGEPQIFGQVKDAFENARQAGTIGAIFERLFQTTFSAAKNVRTDTSIGEHAVSVASSAVNLAQHIFSDLETSEVLIVGAGETAELVVTHLKQHGVTKLHVANRTVERAQELAVQVGAQAYNLQSLKGLLPKADIVISSTASPVPVIGKGWVESAIKERRYKPMLFIDIAVPRDIEEEVGELNDVYLYTVDDLQHIISQNIEQRKKAAEEAKIIIGQHVDEFQQWQRSLNSVGVLRRFREGGQLLAQEQKQRALDALAAGKAPEQVVAELTQRLTNKLLHEPTVAIQQAGRDNNLNALAAYTQIIYQETEK